MLTRMLLSAAEAGVRSREALVRRVRKSAPLWIAFGAAIAIAGPSAPAEHGSVLSTAVGMVQDGILRVLIAAPVAVVVGILNAYAEELALKQIRPRPRWHYVIFMLCYVAAAAIGLLAALRYGQGPMAKTGAALAIWACVSAFAMLGRAASWGQVRPLFWWHHPRWLSGVPAESARIVDLNRYRAAVGHSSAARLS